MENFSVPLSQALNQYLSQPRLKAKPNGLQELNKFIRWCGRDVLVGNLTPQQAAEYGEEITRSSPQMESASRSYVIKDFLTFCFKNQFTSTPLYKHFRVRKPSARSKGAYNTRLSMDITSEGLETMQLELDSLRGERVAVAERIQLAAADKDFRENAPLDAAREQQGLLEARIRELEDSIQRANVVRTTDQKSKSKAKRTVQLGSIVKLQDRLTRQDMVYTIVNASESSPMENKMSVASPVGKALIDHMIGEEIEVSTPRGAILYKIRGIE